MRFKHSGVIALAAVIPAISGCGRNSSSGDNSSLRLVFFPNLTHAPALIGTARGDFQKALGAVKLDVKLVNAGPEAMEALLAGEVDIAYVGPSPAINTYVKSGGSKLRIVAGACSGGAALIASSNSPIQSIKDLNGKRVAIPQLGGTQDVSLRKFLKQAGLQSREKGGSVDVLPARNPDILMLFKQKQLDAAWVPEPWASRLIQECGARLVVDERDLWPDRKFTTTVVVARKAYLDAHPAQVAALLHAHLDVLKWMNANVEAAQQLANAELKHHAGKSLPPAVLKSAWERMSFTDDPDQANIQSFASAAADAGYLKPGYEIAGLVDPGTLESARRLASRK